MDLSQVSFKNHILTWRLNVLMFGVIAGSNFFTLRKFVNTFNRKSD